MTAPSPPQRVVCHVIERLEYGGAEALVHALAAGMRRSRYRSIVCCLQKGQLAARLERDGIPVHCLNLRRRNLPEGPLFLGFVLQLIAGLRRVVKSEGVTILHAHLPDSIIWAACVGAMTGTPVIATYHGLGIIPQDRSRFDPRNRVRTTLYRLAGKWTDRTIAVSEPVRTMLCEQVGLEERKTVLILNGVDTAAVAHACADVGARPQLHLDGRPVIACVGRLVNAKGQRFLIEAMREVIVQFPNAVLLLVGEGPDQPAFEARVQELGLSTHVRFVGRRDDVPGLLAQSSVFVLPSFAEGIPLALIEAMAAGKPVVATAVPGNVDVVCNDRLGVLVPPRDAHALAAAVCAVLADPARSAAMAAAGQAHVRAHFDIGRSIAATLALYDETLIERSPAAGANRP
ncbi:MAG TPA: glycosyltransferase [Vicinamibacterales bacterium]